MVARYDEARHYREGEGAMTGIVQFVPMIAALGAAALWLSGQARNAAAAKRARVVVRARRGR